MKTAEFTLDGSLADHAIYGIDIPHPEFSFFNGVL
jgi:hypothetical protein